MESTKNTKKEPQDESSRIHHKPQNMSVLTPMFGHDHRSSITPADSFETNTLIDGKSSDPDWGIPVPPEEVVDSKLINIIQRQGMTNPTVTFGTVNAASSPAGMNPRIPPRVDTPVTITVTGWQIPMNLIKLSIDGADGNNGSATIDGNATKEITSSETVQLRGVNQTKPGKSANLRLIAEFAGSRVGTSAAFSVSAIPQNYSDTFASLITGPRRGFVVQDGWESDSGTFADLDETEISEEVQYDVGSGCFAAVSGNNSGYLPGNSLTQDSHSTPVALMTAIGAIDANQTCKFKDKRSGSNDIPMKNSGYLVSRTVALNGADFELTTFKRGAATTANGIASQAGAGSITKTQKV